MKDLNTTKENNTLQKFYGKTKASNMVKSVVYRWIQMFERPITEERIKCQLDLVDDKVRVLTSVGFISGKKELPNLLSSLSYANSTYFIEEINVYPCGVGQYTAQARLKFSGMNAAGVFKNKNIEFEADLIKEDELTYKFIRIKIKTLNETEDIVEDSYPLNRASALVHQCMGLIAFDISDPELLNKYFLSDFRFYPLERDFIKENADAIHWINEINTVLNDITLFPVNLSVRVNPEHKNELHIQFDLLFEGTNNEGEHRQTLSKNKWTVIDDPNECFPKIKSIHVEKLDPLFA